MNRYAKAGLLIVTLVIPALIFTFLQLFGTNHYQVPFFHPVINENGAVVKSVDDTLYYQIDCHFPGESGTKFLRKQEFNGRFSVLNYLPEVCGDSCEEVFNQLDRVYMLRSNIEELRLITVVSSTVGNPEKYASELRKEGWNYARFSPILVDSVLYGMLKLKSEIKDSHFVKPERRLVLVDGDAHIRGYYDGTNKKEIERLMAEIKILDYERDIE